MERSKARVFAAWQFMLLRAVSGRSTKVEGALVVITGYRSTDLGSSAVSRYKVERELVVITGYRI